MGRAIFRTVNARYIILDGLLCIQILLTLLAHNDRHDMYVRGTSMFTLTYSLKFRTDITLCAELQWCTQLAYMFLIKRVK